MMPGENWTPRAAGSDLPTSACGNQLPRQSQAGATTKIVAALDRLQARLHQRHAEFRRLFRDVGRDAGRGPAPLALEPPCSARSATPTITNKPRRTRGESRSARSRALTRCPERRRVRAKKKPAG